MVLTLLVAGLAGSAASVLLSLRAATVRQVQQMMGLATMLIAFLPGILVQTPSSDWRAQVVMVMSSIEPVQALLVAGLVLLIDVVLLLAAVARFQRPRLTFVRGEDRVGAARVAARGGSAAQVVEGSR